MGSSSLQTSLGPILARKTGVLIVEALQFRRADRFVADILHAAPDEVWQLLASKGNAEKSQIRAAAKRLRLEQQRLYERETDPTRKITCPS